MSEKDFGTEKSNNNYLWLNTAALTVSGDIAHARDLSSLIPDDIKFVSIDNKLVLECLAERPQLMEDTPPEYSDFGKLRMIFISGAMSEQRRPKGVYFDHLPKIMKDSTEELKSFLRYYILGCHDTIESALRSGSHNVQHVRKIKIDDLSDYVISTLKSEAKSINHKIYPLVQPTNLLEKLLSDEQFEDPMKLFSGYLLNFEHKSTPKGGFKVV